MINIAELLKDCEEKPLLYSPMYGDCILLGVNLEDENFPISVLTEDHYLELFTATGGHNITDSECFLFPSKNVKSWGCFQTIYSMANEGTLRRFADGREDIIPIINTNNLILDIFYLDRVTKQVKKARTKEERIYLMQTGKHIK